MQESSETEPQSIEEDIPTQPGKRHFHRKVRSGCLTCKKRRVKYVAPRRASSTSADYRADAMKGDQLASDVEPRARNASDTPTAPTTMPPQPRHRPQPQPLLQVPAEQPHHSTPQTPLEVKRSSSPSDQNASAPFPTQPATSTPCS
jgi:cytochrome c551/c552